MSEDHNIYVTLLTAYFIYRNITLSRNPLKVLNTCNDLCSCVCLCAVSAVPGAKWSVRQSQGCQRVPSATEEPATADTGTL